MIKGIKTYDIKGPAPLPLSLIGIANLSTILFVDATNGSDSTGTKGSILKPYQTLAAAKNAAVSGDCIKGTPGNTFTLTEGMAKDGIVYDLYFCTVNCTATTFTMTGDAGVALSYKIKGATFNQNSTNGFFCSSSNASSVIEFIDCTITCLRNQGETARGTFRLGLGVNIILRNCTITANGTVPILIDSGSVVKAYDCHIYGSTNDLHTNCIEVRGSSTGKFFNCTAIGSGTNPTVNLAPITGGNNTIEMTNCTVVNTSSGLAFNTVVTGQFIKLFCTNRFVVNTSTYSILLAAGSQDFNIDERLNVNKDVDPAGGTINVLVGEYVVDTNVTYSN